MPLAVQMRGSVRTRRGRRGVHARRALLSPTHGHGDLAHVGRLLPGTRTTVRGERDRRWRGCGEPTNAKQTTRASSFDALLSPTASLQDSFHWCGWMEERAARARMRTRSEEGQDDRWDPTKDLTERSD
ncbi:hypothetical protein GUJ93_ZPchr0006g46238 [Zizania palustris]|uniref:Uncharacterized protein n=1 Tax=Zizania palustris TaxID=103762 RepID=A0A8J5T847_ZIZPA|nr:hypothetical protein GUJ93_ZPchr0006g46238 [Zizania palustris]